MNNHVEFPVTGTSGSFTVPGKILEHGIHEEGPPGAPKLLVRHEEGTAKTCFYEVVALTASSTIPTVKNGAPLRFLLHVNGPGGAPALACIWEP